MVIITTYKLCVNTKNPHAFTEKLNVTKMLNKKVAIRIKFF